MRPLVRVSKWSYRQAHNRAVKLEVHIHLHHDASGELLTRLDRIERKITMNDAETQAKLQGLSDGLTAATDQLNKGIGEVSEEITKLQEAVANAGQTSPATDALFESLTTKVAALKQATQVLDDINPDPTPDTPATP